MTATPTYPVRLEARLDHPSRWIWVFMSILVLPPAIVLAFLWLAVMVLTFVAGVAILFTARYPRAIFDFIVGVMRWTWRVAFYGISAFGTDKYPPFSLQRDPDYPADFTVDYPERLSRGLALVKWWLLAIPHYLVVAIFAGGWTIVFRNNDWQIAGTGLIALLAVIAMVITLLRGRYPDQLFDFIMGMNRWCLRVLAYAALMRDEYPPFRFEPGGPDPAGTARNVAPPLAPAGPRQAPLPA